MYPFQYEDLELSLKNANLKESTDTTCIEVRRRTKIIFREIALGVEKSVLF